MFTNWKRHGRPSGEKQNCAVVEPDGWEDVTCDSLRSYVCEYGRCSLMHGRLCMIGNSLGTVPGTVGGGVDSSLTEISHLCLLQAVHPNCFWNSAYTFPFLKIK